MFFVLLEKRGWKAHGKFEVLGGNIICCVCTMLLSIVFVRFVCSFVNLFSCVDVVCCCYSATATYSLRTALFSSLLKQNDRKKMCVLYTQNPDPLCALHIVYGYI